jgi:hypothetical protein
LQVEGRVTIGEGGGEESHHRRGKWPDLLVSNPISAQVARTQ